MFNVWYKIHNLYKFLTELLQDFNIEWRLYNIIRTHKITQILPFKTGDTINSGKIVLVLFYDYAFFPLHFIAFHRNKHFFLIRFVLSFSILYIYFNTHTYILRMPLPFSLIHRVILPTIFGPIDRLSSREHVKLVYLATCLSIGRVRLLSSTFNVKRVQNYARRCLWMSLAALCSFQTQRCVDRKKAYTRSSIVLSSISTHHQGGCTYILTLLPLAYKVSQSRSFHWRRRHTRTWPLINTLLF